MINTFEPFFKLETRPKRPSIHDWFYISFFFCNYFQFCITIYGYGFRTGIRLFNPLKAIDGKEDKL